MANKNTVPLKEIRKRSDPDDNDIFKVNGYINTFEKCDGNSDVYGRLTERLDELNADIWKDELKRKDLFVKAKKLFTYWTDYCENIDLSNKDVLMKYTQIFSLLENVFRNTLLRPYIPAYRTINMNCGRYSCFVTGKNDENLLEALNFKETSTKLLTYEEQDSTQTILYALTCSVFWHDLSLRIKKIR